jgi:curved DNA-binding protein CbpA
MLKNYYQILGLSPDCNKDDIKKAYRIYATKFHPDKQNNDKFFEERFKEIKEAYDILIDDSKRAQFDSQYKTSNYSPSNFNQYRNKSSSVDDLLSELERKDREKKQKERNKRKKAFYTSKDLVLNGLYVNCGGRSYELTNYDKSTIRKDDNSSFVFIGIVMIIIGIITIASFIGIFLLLFGIYALFFREYYVVLIGKQGDIPLIKGRKAKMRKISRLINRAIEENDK